MSADFGRHCQMLKAASATDPRLLSPLGTEVTVVSHWDWCMRKATTCKFTKIPWRSAVQIIGQTVNALLSKHTCYLLSPPPTTHRLTVCRTQDLEGVLQFTLKSNAYYFLLHMVSFKYFKKLYNSCMKWYKLNHWAYEENRKWFWMGKTIAGGPV